MTNLQRRFEILLPQRFNDGQAVPDELFADTLLELRQLFGAVSSETQVIRGVWEYAGQEYRDELIRIFVDVPDSPESEQFFWRLVQAAKRQHRQSLAVDRSRYFRRAVFLGAI